MEMDVAGEWRSAGERDEIRSPWSGEVVDTVPRAGAAEVELALAAAVEGAAAMRRLAAHERSAILGRAADLVAEAVPELAHTISAEEGKPIAEALGEAGRIPDLLRLSASEGARMHGETLPLDAAPNAAGKLGPALASGNAVILKPAGRTPLTALAFTRLLLEAGLPEHALQRVTGPGGALGPALRLAPEVEAIRVGDPLDEETRLSALISERDAERVEGVVRRALEGGARLVAGGGRDGAVVQPTVVADVDPAMEISRDELFGPAVAVTPVEGIEEAIALANDTSYGLGAGIFTRDVGDALRFARDVEAGSVMINSTPLWRADPMPYGGLKGSGIGREGPRYAIEEMTELKTVVFHGLER